MPIYYEGDMFALYMAPEAEAKGANALVVTTNVTTTSPNGGPIRKEKFGVMGAGCAKEAATRWPAFQSWWANQVAQGFRKGIAEFHWTDGSTGPKYLLSMVVKDNWWQKGPADTDRIVELTNCGLNELLLWANLHPEVKRIIMPYPAIGNARVPKAKIQPMLDKYLDDRFVVCTKGKPDTPPSAQSTSGGQGVSTSQGHDGLAKCMEVVRRSGVMLSVSCTGHRPQDLWGFTKDENYTVLQQALYEIMRHMVLHKGTREFISGMAMGADWIFYRVAIILREEFPELGIKVVAAVPFEQQACKWVKASQNKYNSLVSVADEVVFVDTDSRYRCDLAPVGEYHAAKMDNRNHYMVDRANAVLAIWSGKQNGGTFNCIKYANKVHKPVFGLNPFQL